MALLTRDEIYELFIRARKNARHCPRLDWVSIGEARYLVAWFVKLPNEWTLIVDGGLRTWRWNLGDEEGALICWSADPHLYASSWKARLGAERWLRRNHPDIWTRAIEE